MRMLIILRHLKLYDYLTMQQVTYICPKFNFSGIALPYPAHQIVLNLLTKPHKTQVQLAFQRSPALLNDKKKAIRITSRIALQSLAEHRFASSPPQPLCDLRKYQPDYMNQNRQPAEHCNQRLNLFPLFWIIFAYPSHHAYCINDNC